MRIKLISAILAVLTAASALVGCSGEAETTKRKQDRDEPAVTVKTDKTTKAPETTKVPETTNAESGAETTAPETEQQGNHTDPDVVGALDRDSLPSGTVKLFDIGETVYVFTPSGAAYRDYKSGKYGVISMNGKKYTGKIFEDAEAVGKLVSVRTKKLDTTDLTTVNSCGLLDEELRAVVPAQYAQIKRISDRYVYAIRLTAKTENADEALVYIKDNAITLYPEGAVGYKGVWYVYDVKEGRRVEGVEGSGELNAQVKGEVLVWTDSKGKTRYVSPNGTELPDKAVLLDNGCYTLGGAVYDQNKNKLFTFDTNTTSIKGVEGEERFVAFILRETKYVVLDKNGDKVSAHKFSHTPYVYGNTAISDYTVYDLEGKKLLDEKYISAFDAGEYRVFKGLDGDVAVIDTKDCSVIFKVKDESVTAYSTGELFKTVDGKRMRFNYAERDFTIEDDGYNYELGLTVVKRSDTEKAVVDTLTGKEVLTGYDRYTLESDSEGIAYIMVTDKDYKRIVYAYKR